jgi:hypothetical protein
MRYIAALLALLIALPVWAQDLMNAREFDAYTRGKTLFFYQDGRAYGVERYLDNQRVEWSFLDGECKDGVWYEENRMICFIYEDNPDPQCWAISEGPRGLIARFENRAEATQLYEASEADEEMVCLGPKVGV